MLTLSRAGLVLALAALAQAQFGGQGGGGGGNYGGQGSDGGRGSSSSNNPYSSGDFDYEDYIPSSDHTMIIAHAVLATLAFGFLFPVGGIMIRLASFPGLWWVHGLFQTFAYVLYIAAFAIGVYTLTIIPSQAGISHQAHPIIGIIVFVLLFFQPILGFLHHTMFKKHSRRVVWSYGHIWLGRFVITLGIINGGLGLKLSEQTGVFKAPKGAIIAYGVIAGIMWLLYIASAIYGEMKRKRSSAKGNIMTPPRYQEQDERKAQYA